MLPDPNHISVRHASDEYMICEHNYSYLQFSILRLWQDSGLQAPNAQQRSCDNGGATISQSRQRTVPAWPRGGTARLRAITHWMHFHREPRRYIYKLTVVSLDPMTLGEEVSSAPMEGTLAKGITSVKFSPSLRFVIIGSVVLLFSRETHLYGCESRKLRKLLA